ncbi:hypothetical protein C4K18_1718 [Pseudomonas chlororaphis subsp. aurantiaca]|nr:hypothetical protein C4K18_1718 [Pseudomonas chlororaphis subsp. aurantiaca]
MRLANQALARATIPRTKERCKLRNVAKSTDRRRSEACPRRAVTRGARNYAAPFYRGQASLLQFRDS